jgi:cobalt/nickel transport system permease protein
MIPDWMKQSDSYVPPKGGGAFAIRTMRSVGQVVGRLVFQQGHEKKHALPALLKFGLLVLSILLISLSHNALILMAFTAAVLVYLCTWPAEDIPLILKGALVAACIALILLAPAMIMNPDGIRNNLRVVWKVFVTVALVRIFGHTTQWNHITGALHKLHIPGVFIFTIDITLKYIVLLGRFIHDVLTAYLLRAVGKNDRKYKSVGGVLGITFIRGTEMSTEMYEAMRCRGFTDDYQGL